MRYSLLLILTFLFNACNSIAEVTPIDKEKSSQITIQSNKSDAINAQYAYKKLQAKRAKE